MYSVTTLLLSNRFIEKCSNSALWTYHSMSLLHPLLSTLRLLCLNGEVSQRIYCLVNIRPGPNSAWLSTFSGIWTVFYARISSFVYLFISLLCMPLIRYQPLEFPVLLNLKTSVDLKWRNSDMPRHSSWAWEQLNNFLNFLLKSTRILWCQ